jgi:hypothetical protein
MAPRKAPPRQPHGRNIRGHQARPRQLRDREVEARLTEAYRSMNARKAAPKRRESARELAFGQSVFIDQYGNQHQDPRRVSAARRVGRDPGTR